VRICGAASNRPKSTPIIAIIAARNHLNSLKLACARINSHFQETSANGFSQRSGRKETGSAGVPPAVVGVPPNTSFPRLFSASVIRRVPQAKKNRREDVKNPKNYFRSFCSGNLLSAKSFQPESHKTIFRIFRKIFGGIRGEGVADFIS
jgi:hypothetical protein